MSPLSAPMITLPGGTTAPQVALGTWPMNDEEVAQALGAALEIGYRHVDTAENYENERGVGRAIAESSVPRSDLFVTTKFNKRWHADPRAGVEGNLERLGMDYVDLILIHWPNPAQAQYVTAWEGLVGLREERLVKAIGMSNFRAEHIEDCVAATGVLPAVNQIELHPYLDRAEERAYHAERGIVTESWSPLGRGNGLLDEDVVRSAAQRHGKTPGQIILRWHVELGLMFAAKSADPQRLRDNLDIFDFSLSREEVEALTALSNPDLSPVDSRRFGH